MVDGGVTVLTVTVAFAAGEVPPVPEHVTEYVVVLAGETVAEPEVPEAVKPVPVHEVAFVELHESVADPPAEIEVGFAERVAVGAEVGVGGVTVPEVGMMRNFAWLPEYS